MRGLECCCVGLLLICPLVLRKFLLLGLVELVVVR